MSQLKLSTLYFLLLICFSINGNNYPNFAYESNSTPHMDSPFTSHQERLSPELRESILKNAPKKITDLIKNLNEGLPIESFIILEGPPGTGKTSLAQAIAETSNCNFVVIEAHAIKNEYQNSGSQNLIRAFDPIIKENKPYVIVIDEITRLTDQHESKHNSDKGTSTSLWIMLDKCENLPHILLIGTTNEFQDIPKPILDRFPHANIKIDYPNEEQRYNLLVFLCKDINIPLASNIDLRKVAKDTKSTSIRKLKGIVKTAAFKSTIRCREANSPIIISQIDFTEAVKEVNPSEGNMTKVNNVVSSINQNEDVKNIKYWLIGTLVTEITRDSWKVVYPILKEVVQKIPVLVKTAMGL